MKNPIKSLRSAWNRTKTNHPAKTHTTAAAGITGSAIGLGTMMIPFDGGLTFGVSCILGSIGTLGTGAVGIVHNSDIPHNEFETLSHNGQRFTVTKAQKYKYGQLERKIDNLRDQHKHATSEGRRKSLQKKAQKLLDYQEDILDSKNVRRADLEMNPPEMSLKYRQRSPGN